MQIVGELNNHFFAPCNISRAFVYYFKSLDTQDIPMILAISTRKLVEGQITDSTWSQGIKMSDANKYHLPKKNYTYSF